MLDSSMCCTACGKELKPVFPDVSPVGGQYDEALELRFVGGYGMFIDPMERLSAATICEDCANDLCDRIPWINRFIGPSSSRAPVAQETDKEEQVQ